MLDNGKTIAGVAGRARPAGGHRVDKHLHEPSISTPFGGFKQSGLGREKGRRGMRLYMEPKGLFWNVS